MKRLCGLMLFCIGIGMTWVLILPKSFLLVVIAVGLMIIGYNLFCCRSIPIAQKKSILLLNPDSRCSYFDFVILVPEVLSSLYETGS